MSPLLKLGGFAVLLAAVFAAAVLAGGAAGPLNHEPSEAASGDGGHRDGGGGSAAHGAESGGHGGDSASAPQAVRGLGVSENGLTLRLARASAAPGRRFRLAFHVVDRDGHVVRDFDVEHTKRMHLIVVRRDMTGFQHLHPRQAADGSWSTPLSLPRAGSYRVFADFSSGERAYTLAADLTADGPFRAVPLPAAAASARAGGGLRVALRAPAGAAGEESELRFAVTRRGRPVAVEPYLGARGHLVALRESDLAFLHVHPDERRLAFAAELPSAGRYRLFLQFKVGGQVRTAEFTREVAR